VTLYSLLLLYFFVVLPYFIGFVYKKVIFVTNISYFTKKYLTKHFANVNVRQKRRLLQNYVCILKGIKQ